MLRRFTKTFSSLGNKPRSSQKACSLPTQGSVWKPARCLSAIVAILIAIPLCTQAQNPDWVINAKELSSLLSQKTPAYVLDVRQPQEYATGHIDNAVLIPLNSLPDRYRELPRDIPIAVYCKSGARSAQAVEFLRASGYDKVFSLAGGYGSWMAERSAAAK